jgi:hypothetical protein
MKTITMERHYFFGVLIIILLSTLFIMYGYIQNLTRTPQLQAKPPKAEIMISLPNTADVIPISAKNSHVVSGTIAYTLQGKIVKVGTDMLTLDTFLPSLPLTKDVKITKRSKLNTQTKVPLSTLKENTPVSITTTYDLKTQKWLVLTITII